METVAKKKASSLGARIRALRGAAGFTQVEVAAHVGVTEQTFIRWEQDKSEPSFSELCAIAAMFGKTPNDFTTGGGESQG